MKRMLKRMIGVSALAALAYALWRAFDRAQASSTVTWEPKPFPFPPEPRRSAPEPAVEPEPPVEPEPTVESSVWIEPDDGACPVSHPVKVKVASGIFHVPGGMNYTRTKADRCYADPDAAEADGFRPAKR
jgi:hypothetical protein